MVTANSTEASDAALALLSTKTKQDEAITALNLQAKLTDVQPVELRAAGSAIATGSGAANAQTLRVVQAADSPLTVLTGPLTESAPASDTASSALNGRLQRIAQNLTGLTSVFKVAGQFLAQSIGVALPRKETITGIATTAATVNANLLSNSATATDVRDYNSAELTIISTATTGSYTIQCSPDPSFAFGVTTLQAFESTVQNANPLNAAITPTASTRRFGLNLTGINYIRVNLMTGAIGIQAIAVLSQMAFVPYQVNVQQATGTSLVTNLGASVSIASSQTLATVTTVNNVTSAQLANQSPSTTDVASAAITTSATTSAFTPAWGVSSCFSVLVSAVTGTVAPTLDIVVQESVDGANNWATVYTFPQITAGGSYVSPLFGMAGRSYRYVQTVGGASPSFTRAIFRYSSNVSAPLATDLVRLRALATRKTSPTIRVTTTTATDVIPAPSPGTNRLVISAISVQNTTDTYTEVAFPGTAGTTITIVCPKAGSGVDRFYPVESEIRLPAGAAFTATSSVATTSVVNAVYYVENANGVPV